MFCISNVSAGFLDGFFSEDSNSSDDNNVLFSDMGIKGNNSSDWHFLKSLKVSVTDKGTTLVNKGEGNTFYTVNKPSTSMENLTDLIEWDAPYTIEFDLISCDNSSGILITDGVNGISKTFEQLGVTSNSHIKIVNEGSTVNYYVNGVNDPVYTYNEKSVNQSAIRFVIPQDASLSYKNFTIYK